MIGFWRDAYLNSPDSKLVNEVDARATNIDARILVKARNKWGLFLDFPIVEDVIGFEGKIKSV